MPPPPCGHASAIFYTPPSLFDPPTYPRKKPLQPADQPEEADAPQEVRQQQLRHQSAPQEQTLVQRNAVPLGQPPGRPDEQQNFHNLAESRIPSNTTPFRPKDAQSGYLRRLTELGRLPGALPKILQPRPGPMAAATPQSTTVPNPAAERPLPATAVPPPSVKETPPVAQAAAQLENARKAGAVIEGGKMITHPDGQGGLLNHTGFALTSPRDHPLAGTSIPYRDDRGGQHQIPVQSMRRITDPSGITSYHFLVDGKPVRVPEGSTPLFQIDHDGRRYTQTPDGTRRELGYAPIATSQKSVNSREQAAGEQKLEASKLNELGVIGNPVQHGLKKEDGSSGYDEYLRPDLAEQVRLRDANTHFLQQEYPDIPVEDLRQNYNAYRDDYVRRNYDLPDGVDDKTFHHLNGKKIEQRSRVAGAAGAGVSSAVTSGQKLQAMAEWRKTHPNAGEDEQAAWHRTYDQVTSIIDPYRNAVHKALDGGEQEQDALLNTLADLPELHRELLMRYAATVAKQRGENHMLGVGDTVGASAQRTLRDMFTSVSRVPWSLKKQVEEGQTSFNGPIISVDQALEALSADLQDSRHHYGKRVQQVDALPLRPLTEKEKGLMTQALQREKRRNRLAITMRSILDEAEPLNDTVLGKMAAGLGSSLPLVLATTPQGMLLAGAGYANADFHEIMAAHPEMDEAAASKVALVSGAVKAGLDKLSLFGLGKLAPNVAKVLSGEATSQMVKKTALQAAATYGFENIQEGLQDLTRPAVQSLAASLDQDVHGVDWDREMKQFWGSRLDVALGVLPLTLLGIGHNTLQNRQSVLEILNNDKTLKLAGLAENDRAGILKAAQAGDEAKSQALLQEAWSRRDPAVAASAIQETDGAQAAAAQSLKEQKSGASDQSAPPANNGQPSQSTSSEQQPPSSLPSPEEISKAIDGIARLKEKAEAGELSPEEKLELDQHEKTRAATRVYHLETEQEALSKLNPPRELNPVKAKALEDERAILQRPVPGAPPQASPPSQIPANTTRNATASGDGAPTISGLTAPPVGHGNLIPESTTHPDHLDLARRRAENLEKIAAKRKLDPHEQAVYDNARRVLDRNNPDQRGDHSTGNPDDLAMSGDEDALVPVTPDTKDAAADTPAAAAPAPPTNATGTTIHGLSSTSPDATTASAGTPALTLPTGSAGTAPSASTAITWSATPPPIGGPAVATTGTSASTSVSPSSGSTAPPSAISGNPASTSGSPATSPAKTPLPKLDPLPPIPFPENSPEARIEREKRAPVRKAILDNDGIKPADKAKILGTDKGKRPDPKTYMSDAFIKAHREEFIDGATRIMTSKNLHKYGPSHTDGTSYVFPTKKVAEAIKEAGGDRGKLEDLLGIPRGQLGVEALSRVDFKNPSSLNIRVPSGNEAGANDQWLPGSRLPTGMLEGVLDGGSATRDMWTDEDLSIK